MIVKNLTSKLQELKVEELAGGRGFSIYVEGHSSTELTDVYIPDTQAIKGIFEVVSGIETPQVDKKEEEGPADDLEGTKKDDLNDDSEENESSETPVAEDVFICDICGAEFASARGLASHKNRVHLDESNK